MIPMLTCNFQAVGYIPRASGDDPSHQNRLLTLFRYSPRERG